MFVELSRCHQLLAFHWSEALYTDTKFIRFRYFNFNFNFSFLLWHDKYFGLWFLRLSRSICSISYLHRSIRILQFSYPKAVLLAMVFTCLFLKALAFNACKDSNSAGTGSPDLYRTRIICNGFHFRFYSSEVTWWFEQYLSGKAKGAAFRSSAAVYLWFCLSKKMR